MRWTAKWSVDRHSLFPRSSSQHISSSLAVVFRPGKWQWTKGLSPLGDPTLTAPLLTWYSERNIPKKEHGGFKKKKIWWQFDDFQNKSPFAFQQLIVSHIPAMSQVSPHSKMFLTISVNYPGIQSAIIRKKNKKNPSASRYAVICVMHVIC